jgi:hypothetical protein
LARKKFWGLLKSKNKLNKRRLQTPGLRAMYTDYRCECVSKKGQSPCRIIFYMDRGLYHSEKLTGINLIPVTVSQKVQFY